MPRRSKDGDDDGDGAGEGLEPVELTETYGLCVDTTNPGIIPLTTAAILQTF